jgi:tetratricopeptide (TPR) repeat protein
MHRIYADILVSGRRYDEAIRQYQVAIDLDPNFPASHYFLGRAYEAKGMYDDAVRSYTRASELGSVLKDVLVKTNDVYKKSGWKAYVQFNLDQLVLNAPQRRYPAFMIATFYARLGRDDEALTWLEKGYEERDGRMMVISIAFEFDRLRSDPRFKDLVHRIGLPE